MSKMSKMSKFFKSLGNVIKTIGNFLLIVAWMTTFVCITYGLTFWSLAWSRSMLTNFLNLLN